MFAETSSEEILMIVGFCDTKNLPKVSRKGKMEAFNKMICRESQVYLIKGAVGKELFQKNKYQKDLRV